MRAVNLRGRAAALGIVPGLQTVGSVSSAQEPPVEELPPVAHTIRNVRVGRALMLLELWQSGNCQASDCARCGPMQVRTWRMRLRRVEYP